MPRLISAPPSSTSGMTTTGASASRPTRPPRTRKSHRVTRDQVAGSPRRVTCPVCRRALQAASVADAMAAGWSGARGTGEAAEAFVQIRPEVLDVLDPHRHPAQRGGHTGGGIARPAGPALDRALHVAETGGVGEQVQTGEDPLGLLRRAEGLEGDHRPAA